MKIEIYNLFNTIKSFIDNKINSLDSVVVKKSSTTGLLKNDGTVDTNTYLTSHQSLSNYVEKSNTSGLIKNDGTIDTNTYLTSHQDISGKANTNHTQASSTITDLTTETITITYDDDSTEILKLYVPALFKDISSQGGISQYNPIPSYDTTENCYTNTSNGYRGYLQNYTFPRKVEISCDIKGSGNIGIFLGNVLTALNIGINRLYIYELNSGSATTRNNLSYVLNAGISSDTWYHIVSTFNNGDVSMIVYSNGTEINRITATENLLGNSNPFGFWVTNTSGGGSLSVKNILIKEL